MKKLTYFMCRLVVVYQKMFRDGLRANCMLFRKYSIIFLCLLIPSTVLADDFRGNSWGNSISDVKKQEKATFVSEEKGCLYYEGIVADIINVSIVYRFFDGHLSEGVYFSQESYVNRNLYIRDYERLKELLIKKYGEPDSDKTVWRNRLYKDNPEKWGTAISIGHLAYMAEWNTKTTRITTGLTGSNFDVRHGVFYNEKASEKEREKQEEEQMLDQL